MQPTANAEADLPRATYYTANAEAGLRSATSYLFSIANAKAGIHMHTVQPTVTAEAGLPTTNPKRAFPVHPIANADAGLSSQCNNNRRGETRIPMTSGQCMMLTRFQP